MRFPSFPMDSLAPDLADEFTGLLARRPFLALVEEAMVPGRACAILLVEVDRLSRLFQTDGQGAVDSAVATLGQRVVAACGPEAVVARFSQTQVVAWLPRLAGPEEADATAGRLAESLTEPATVAGRSLSVTPKIGLAVHPRDAADGLSLVQAAAMALTEAVRSPSAVVLPFSPTMGETVRTRAIMESDLREALADGRFHLEYQPKVCLDDGRTTGAEALLRWRDPVRGLIPPSTFIPVAEDIGLIVPLGEWALREALRQLVAWRAAGMPDLQLAVNVSERQFRGGQLPVLVAGLLHQLALPPHLLQLEITESVLPADLEGALAQMRAIADLGVALALDDFGTGYSSLSYLRDLPLDCLKIDRKFTMDLESDSRTRHIVEAIVAMARAMDLKVVAEGIETERQWAFLRDLGVEEGQGYLFSRPLGADAFSAYLET